MCCSMDSRMVVIRHRIQDIHQVGLTGTLFVHCEPKKYTTEFL